MHRTGLHLGRAMLTPLKHTGSRCPLDSMPVLVHKYQSLKKPEADGKLTPFQPLRAVGLALEKAWKLYKTKGHCSVTAEALGAVEVTGSRKQGLALEVRGEAGWRKCLTATLQLQAEDASLSKELFDLTFQYIRDLNAVVLDVDLEWPSGDGSFDLILDPYQKLCGVTGRVWVELKVWKPSTYKTEANKLKKFLAAKLEEVHAAEPTIQAIILVVLKVGRSGKDWADPDVVAEFRAQGSESWKDLSPHGGKVAAGQVQVGAKPSFGEVWAQVEWHPDPQPRGVKPAKLGLFGDFLKAHGKPAGSCHKRAATFNEILKKKGFVARDRLRHVRLRNKQGGPKFWVGSKSVFKRVRQFCM